MMGFSEDDRIRSKNAVANASYDMYHSLSACGFSNRYIIAHCESHLKDPNNTEIRNNILLAVINIARSSDENTSNT